MARKKKEPKVEKVFKSKKGKSAEVVSEEIVAEEVKKTSDIDDFLGVEAPQEEDSDNKLSENLSYLVDVIVKAKPQAVKGKYITNISISSTMGPGIKIDQNSFDI